MLQNVLEHLSAITEPSVQQTAALAQLWMVLALVEAGDPAPAAGEIERIDLQDDAVVHAIDSVLRELNGQARWRTAVILLIGFKVDSLDARGQRTLATQTRQGFIDALAGKWNDIPAVAQLVERFRSDLASD